MGGGGGIGTGVSLEIHLLRHTDPAGATPRAFDLRVKLDCKTVVFFANASDGQYSNEKSGASLKTARENGERR